MLFIIKNKKLIVFFFFFDIILNNERKNFVYSYKRLRTFLKKLIYRIVAYECISALNLFISFKTYLL